MTPATAVVSYRRRARFCRTETRNVRRPQLLRDLLGRARHVAEVPCGAGHFLAAYARANIAVTLVDASPEMLGIAVEQAHSAGIPSERLLPRIATVQQLPCLGDADVVVMPHGALNQLACQTTPSELLAGLRAVMRPGAHVLAQVACTHPGGGTDTSTFYDPRRQHGVWFADRSFDSAHAAGAVLRRRRQHRDGPHVRVEFDYRGLGGQRLHVTEVELVLLSISELVDAFMTAGFAQARVLPDHSGLSEVLATIPGRSPR